MSMNLSKNATENKTLSNQALGVYTLLALGMAICDNHKSDASVLARKIAMTGNEIKDGYWDEGVDELQFAGYLDDFYDGSYLDDNGHKVFASDIIDFCLNSGADKWDVSPVYDVGAAVNSWVEVDLSEKENDIRNNNSFLDDLFDDAK